MRTVEDFGLFAIMESKRVILPLKGVECDFSVASGVVEVSMTQIFNQDNGQALDCEYLFPLPADASVFCCQADINGRVIRAQVREREEARQIAAEKKAAGFRTALVESERNNLFTLSLGNIQPNDLIIVQLKYFQTLRSVGEARSLEIPFCPGIRYIPGRPLLRSNQGKGIEDDTDEVADASRITPVRIDAEHPDAAYIEVRGRLDGKFVSENSLASPSHAIAAHRTGDEMRISLRDKAEVPDRDFVLRWNERDPQAVASRVWLQEKGDEVYALLEVRAPRQTLAERSPVDFYFLVDRSGSMRGEKWNKAVEALQSCIRVLGPGDRAMITFFESGFRDFAERPLPVQQLTQDRQFECIQRLGTDGGTEMRPALDHVLNLAATHSQGRDKNLILITDAQIGNESAILHLMKGMPDLPVHCFGIDVALNDSLLLALCRQQGGTFHSLSPNDNIEGAVTSLGKTLGQPVLLDLKLSDGWEMADARIPHVYAGQIHYLSARSTDGMPLELTARSPKLESVRMPFEKQSGSMEAPYLHWCRSRIQRRMAEGREKEAVALSVQANLLCPLTAFVAWDEAEKVTVASHSLVQPNMELLSKSVAGMSYGRARAFPRSPRGTAMVFGTRSDDNTKFGGGSVRDVGSGPIEELVVECQLTDMCDRAGVAEWQLLVKAILDWIAEAKDAERSRRIKSVNRLLEEIKPHAQRLEQFKASPQEKDEARQQIHRLLQLFVESCQLNRAT
jgi:Ca-activated chloride channel family protein